MKHKIKFRGKSTKTGTWHYGSLLTDNSDWACIIDILPNNKVVPETIGQFTEMYDNNGNEIYEGDVLRNIPFPEVVGEVIKSHGCWVIKYNEEETADDYNLLYDVLRDYDYCVIGNIYDNSGLIKRSERNENQ